MTGRMHRAGFFLAAWLAALPAAAQPEPLAVSGGLIELLRAEMREVSAGMQKLVPAIATGDFATVREVGHQIEQSYILNARLTESQRAELKRLPEGFKLLDGRFHGDAAGLAEAARTHDSALVQFRYERLFRGCMACHEAYAPRFAKQEHVIGGGHEH